MILDLVQIINYIAIVCISTSFFLENKKCIAYKNVKICLLGVVALIFSLINCNVGIYFCFQVVFSYSLIHILFVGDEREKLILAVMEISSMANISMMIESIFNMVCDFLHLAVSSVAIDILIGIVILIMLILARYKMKNNLHWGQRKIGIKYVFFFMFLLIIECFMVTGMGEVIYKEVDMTRKLAFEMVYILMIIFTFIQIGLMIALIISRNVYREKECLAAKYLEEQKLHYEYLENRERQTRKFRHDIKSHLVIINDLLHKKQYKQCKAYLEELNLRIDSFSYKISVNNGIADAIVNKCYMEARQKGITLHVKGHLPDPCNLSAFDSCTIISNLLNNAIEAEDTAGGKDVYVEFRYTDGEIMLVVENDFKQDLEQNNGVFFTTKEDKMNHGFGLENVKECVKRNNGQITIDTQNHIFRVLVCVDNGECVDEDCNC